MKKILSIIAILTLTLTAMAEDITAEQPSVGNGSASSPYEIATAGNLVWFANQVNSGSQSICGKLTADVNLGSDQTMIGTESNKYSGTFNGDGHTVTVKYYCCDLNDDCAGFFLYISGATITNLKLAGSINSYREYISTIAGYCNSSTISNCVSYVSFTYDPNTLDYSYFGGIAGYCRNSRITNCAFYGSINGTLNNPTIYRACGILSCSTGNNIVSDCLFAPSQISEISYSEGYTIGKGSVEWSNCCYSSEMGVNQGTKVSSAQLSSGEACWKLNSGVYDGTQAWYQKIDTDSRPLPFSEEDGIVYGGGYACPSSSNYANTTHNISDDYTDGITTCKNEGCGAEVYQVPTLADGYYQISNKGNLIWFAQQVNNGNTTINGKLTADVSLGDRQTMIGTSSDKYSGTFDGGNHTITVDYTCSGDYAALFRYANSATIQNLNTAGTITSTAKFMAGFVAYNSGTTNISNCASSIVETCNFSSSSDGNHGGIVADNEGNVNMTNVLFYGQLLGSDAINCGGFVGWTTADGSATLKNCWFNPSAVTFSNDGSYTLARGSGTNNISNCYYSTAYGATTQGTATTAEQVRCGYLCQKLGTTAWKQDLESDVYPVLVGSTGSPTGVTYSRIMTNQWGTIVVPFDVNIDSSEPYDFYQLSDVSGSTLTLTKMTGTLSAGTPALIRMSEASKSDGKYELSLPVGTISATSNNPTAVGGLTLTGAFTSTEITDCDGYIIANNSFWNIADIKGENKVFCPPFRAWLSGSISSGAKQLTIGFDDDIPTAVKAINAITEGAAEYYDINGRKLRDLQQGVNIIKMSDGTTKKVIIK